MKKQHRKRLALTCFFVAALSFSTQSGAQDASENLVRGVVKPVNEAAISTELASIVAKVPFREGEAFEKGALLISFRCEQEQAQLRAAKAASRARLIDWKNKRELLRYKAIGANEVRLAEAAFAEARANAEALAAQTGNCEVVAPFAGRVVERTIHPHEMPVQGKPLLRIISDKALELDLLVPSAWLVWMRPGQTFDFAVDETGERVQARVSQVGASVDPVSQTVKIKGVFERTTKSVLSGMSGTATFHRSDS